MDDQIEEVSVPQTPEDYWFADIPTNTQGQGGGDQCHAITEQ